MDCPLYISGRQAGVLRITEEGRDTRFTVRAAAPGGLYRLYARGERGDLLLGAWEGGAMSRLFSRELTEPAGRFFSAVAYPVDGAGESWLPALLNLSWDAVSNADHYRIMGLSQTFTYYSIHLTSNLYYNLSTDQNDCFIRFKVVAENSNGNVLSESNEIIISCSDIEKFEITALN